MNSAQTFYIARSGETEGPYSADKIYKLLAEGVLTNDDLLFDQAEQSWVSIGSAKFQPLEEGERLQTAGLAASASPRIWNPTAAVSWSLIFSPLFGQILHYKNWRALGDVTQARASVKWMFASGALLALNFLLLVNDDVTSYLNYAYFPLLVVWYFAAAKKQARQVKRLYGTTYKRKGWFLPLAVGLGAYAVFISAGTAYCLLFSHLVGRNVGQPQRARTVEAESAVRVASFSENQRPDEQVARLQEEVAQQRAVINDLKAKFEAQRTEPAVTDAKSTETPSRTEGKVIEQPFRIISSGVYNDQQPNVDAKQSTPLPESSELTQNRANELLSQYTETFADEARAQNSGLGESHPTLKALRAKRDALMKRIGENGQEQATSPAANQTPVAPSQGELRPIIKERLPTSFKSDTEYEIEGLFLLQNLNDGWLTDLVPNEVSNSISIVEDMKKNRTGWATGEEAFNVTMDGLIREKIYKVGQQPVILAPRNPDAFASVNLPARLTLLRAKGNFIKFQTYPTAAGATARAPVFIVDELQLSSGEVINLRTDQ